LAEWARWFVQSWRGLIDAFWLSLLKPLGFPESPLLRIELTIVTSLLLIALGSRNKSQSIYTAWRYPAFLYPIGGLALIAVMFAVHEFFVFHHWPAEWPFLYWQASVILAIFACLYSMVAHWPIWTAASASTAAMLLVLALTADQLFSPIAEADMLPWQWRVGPLAVAALIGRSIAHPGRFARRIWYIIAIVAVLIFLNELATPLPVAAPRSDRLIEL
jgi:hypothetical protein